MTDFDPGKIARLYDDIASVYSSYYEDYEAVVRKQGADLAGILVRAGIAPPSRVLDCSCGIGTQAIGLALEGFEVSGCDISPLSIAEARANAARFDRAIDFNVRDMRHLSGDATFDAVISCGNSLAHLLSDMDMTMTLDGAARLLRPGGIFLAALTDHENGIRDENVFYDSHVGQRADLRTINFQLWTWIERGVTYVCDDYTIEDGSAGTAVKKVSAPFRIWRRDELFRRGRVAGFEDPAWLEPAQTAHHNPVLQLRKSHAV